MKYRLLFADGSEYAKGDLPDWITRYPEIIKFGRDYFVSEKKREGDIALYKHAFLFKCKGGR
jgi:hypothetical protein